MAMTRIPGWEQRLAATIAEIRLRPYRLGEHDCLSASCAAIQALSGVDLWPQYRGRYETHFGMMRFIFDLVGSADFAGAFTAICGVKPGSVLLARRGDILEYRDDHGTSCLAVCAGAYALVPARTSWEFIPITACRKAWRIG